MGDLEIFRKRVKDYSSLAERASKNRKVREKRGMTQEDLADACRYNRSELNKKLNGKSPIFPIVVKKIVIALAEHQGITSKSQAKELLTLMDVPDFSPIEWNTYPLNRLEGDAEDNDKRISFNDTGIP